MVVVALFGLATGGPPAPTGAGPPATTANPQQLLNEYWQLDQVVEPSGPWEPGEGELRFFDNGTFTAVACNAMRGDAWIDGPTLRLEKRVTTLTSCADRRGRAERVLDILMTAPELRWSIVGDTLYLDASGGWGLRFRR